MPVTVEDSVGRAGVVAVAPAPAADGTTLDVADERSRTPGCGVAHHFNAAGAALPTGAVVAGVVDHLRLEELRGGYEAAALEAERLEAVYASAARLIGAAAEEIALFESATSGLTAILDALRLRRGDRVLVSRSTYVSHALHLLALEQEHGVEVSIVPNGADGAVDLGALEDMLAAGAALVCVAHVPTSSGLVEPVVEIGSLAARSGVRFLLDATQSVGQLAVDVTEIGCDALVTTGRKFLRAPRGTAFGYVRGDLLEQLRPTAPDVRGAVWTGQRSWDLAATARRFETWEASIAGRIGLGIALDEALERGVDRTERHLVGIAARMRAALTEIPRVVLHDPPAATSAIVTFTVEGLSAPETVRLLAEQQVRTVSVPATHAQWDLGDRGVTAVVRASAHVYNDDDDLDALRSAVARIADVGSGA